MTDSHLSAGKITLCCAQADSNVHRNSFTSECFPVNFLGAWREPGIGIPSDGCTIVMFESGVRGLFAVCSAVDDRCGGICLVGLVCVFA